MASTPMGTGRVSCGPATWPRPTSWWPWRSSTSRGSDAAFRAELRAWLSDVLPGIPPPPPEHDFEARRVYDTAWQRMLFDAGYAGINWPADCGGRGATPAEHLIFLEESERLGAPYV